MAIDPVCKMRIEPQKAEAKEEYGGQLYYFCSAACHKAFVAEPQKYASHQHGGPAAGAPPQHGHHG